MNDQQKRCLVCERTSNDVPVITITFAEKEYYICPGDLPVLIHHPEQLAKKLPGAANLKPQEH